MHDDHYETWHLRVVRDVELETMSMRVTLPEGAEYVASAHYMSVRTGMGRELKSLTHLNVTLSNDEVLSLRGRISQHLDDVTIDLVVPFKNGHIVKVTVA